MAKSKQEEIEKQKVEIEELTSDVQRMRADFENYRKRVDAEKTAARAQGKSSAILKLLPVIDNIERAVVYIPDDLKENTWAQGVASLAKNINKSLEAMDVKRIDAAPGTEFNPELHEAIQFDDSATGEKEVIEAELQAGYLLDGHALRHPTVKVTRH